MSVDAKILPLIRRWDLLTPLLIVLLSLLPASVAQMQDASVPAQNFHRWGSVTLFNGLPSDSVRAIAQTPDGLLWFGTDNGLARFDGRRVQKFTFGDSKSDRILALKTVSTGDLWVGTENGAFILNDGRFQPVAGVEGLAVTAILLGSDSFLTTDSGKVLQVKTDDAGARTSISLTSEPVTGTDSKPIRITSLIRDENRLLIGTSSRGVLVRENGLTSELPSSPRPIFVNALAWTSTGDLWIGSDAKKGMSGIYLRESDSRATRVPAATANITALEQNEEGLWAGSDKFGLFHIRDMSLTETFTFENTSGGLRSNTIFAVFTDREGVVWIGTNRGVSRYDPQGPLQQTVSDIPNSNFIRTLTRGGQLYAGSNRGLFVLDGDSHWTEVPGLKNKVVYAIRQRAGASMIVGTAEGMFDTAGKKLADGDIRSFADFKVRGYAAVFGRGVADITGDDQRVVFDDETVTSVYGRWDKLWIGTSEHGLFSFNGILVKNEAGPDLLKSGTIWNMFQSRPEGPLFIAGQHGVFAFREGKIEQIIEAKDVRDVVEIDGQVWAATTSRGLLHARHDDRFGWLVSYIGFEQGLPSEKAFAIRPAGNKLVIATNRGIVTYRSGTVAPKLIPIRILSQRLHDLGEMRSTIELDYPQNSILLEVAGLSSRTFPEEFQYAFILKNDHGEIIDSRLSKDPQYAPTDISPGSYTIEAVGFDRDLLASEPLTIQFSVAIAPFPRTATALGILLAIALIALVWVIIERRRIVLRNRELAAARFDLANEAERERRRIARDLHDQTLADLRNLMMTSDKLTPPNPEFREEIEAVSTEIRRICEDLSPSVLENVGFVAALEFLLSHTIENHKFIAADNVEEMIRFPVNVQLQIYRIAQEVLANIKRHANADIVEMEISITVEGCFQMEIRDDGQPFDPAETSTHGRGIPNIRSRASLINAAINWEKLDGGTRFIFTKDLHSRA